MSQNDSNNTERDEIDPLLPINEEQRPHDAPADVPSTSRTSNHASAHSPTHRRARRPSFGTTFLSKSPQQSRQAADTPRQRDYSSSSYHSNHSGHEHTEVDALGMIHNDLSGTSINSELVGGGTSFIDHTRFNQFAPSRKTFPDPTAHHRRQSSLSSTSSRNKYIPLGVQPPLAPSQMTRPSFAEQWVKRQNSSDITNTGSSPFSGGSKNPFLAGEKRVSYGAIPSHDGNSKRKNSAERRFHKLTPHHDRYGPIGDVPFSDDYADTLPQGHLHRSTSSSSETDEFEFSGSNPSSRRSSDSASLDDVCFPLVDIDEEGGQKSWPDIQVLEEFAKEERKELNEISKASAAEFQEQQQHQFDTTTRNSSFSTSSGAVNFQTPLISNIDSNAPLSKFKINETEPINGRLRPPKIVPWDPKSRSQASAPLLLQSANTVPTMQQNNFEYSRSLIEQFRFTYFREDLDSTIHSPTISGLLHDDQSFADLFSPSHYSNPSSNSLSGSGLLDSASKHNNNSASVSRTPTVTKTPTPSIRGLEPNEIAPFWLDVLNPTEEEMKVLAKSFGIHPLTTEDIFLGETREKVELFRDYYLVCFRSFDIVHERYKQKKAWEKKAKELHSDEEDEPRNHHESKISSILNSIWKRRKSTSSNKGSSASIDSPSLSSSFKLKQKRQRLRENKQKGGYRHKPREGELAPLNMYIIVFREGVITFHFAPTPHPVNVRRRARLLRDYLTVSADWIGYALIDDITDAFAPMIESIEDEVNAIEDAILKMNSYDSDDDSDYSDESDSDSDDSDDDKPFWKKPTTSSKSMNLSDNKSSYSKKSKKSSKSTRSSSTVSSSSSSSSSRSTAHIAGWKRKGDMLRRIGECRKKVMSILRLLGSKADVIKGFAKRCNEQWEVAPRSEIGMYLGDIQDHIVTMVQSLNHYEKLLARSHSNYLAQINIDMTRVNNDMNDVLGKITILGTVVLPMNIITGLWGMNVIVPGQDIPGLHWFFGILVGMCLLAFLCFVYARRAAGFN